MRVFQLGAGENNVIKLVTRDEHRAVANSSQERRVLGASLAHCELYLLLEPPGPFQSPLCIRSLHDDDDCYAENQCAIG